MIPSFGEKLPDVKYQLRNGVYVILKNKQAEIALIQAPNQAYLLPGGEIENGESHLEAIKRELIEEMGVSAEVGVFLGQADEYFYSSFRRKYYYNPAFIYSTKSWIKLQEPLEANNNIAWFTPKEAIQRCKRASHKWGIEQWLKLFN